MSEEKAEKVIHQTINIDMSKLVADPLIIHTMSNQKHNKISTLDIALWHASCLCYLALGYELKLYCSKKDLKWLEKNKLLGYYKYLDFDTFDQVNETSYPLSKVNDEVFWFIRKMVAIDHEFEVNKEPFMYSDTDIMIFKKFHMHECDCIFWTLEDRKGKQDENDFYCSWDCFSKPEGYVMPDYIKNTDNTNYNLGLVYFKDKEIFKQYFGHVLNFIVDNPCEFHNELLENVFEKTHQKISRLWCLNAEQRICTGFVKEKGLNVRVFDENGLTKNGESRFGVHFFRIKNVWNQVTYFDHFSFDSLEVVFALQKLVQFKNFLLTQFKNNELDDYYNFFIKKKQFRDIERLEKALNDSLKDLQKQE